MLTLSELKDRVEMALAAERGEGVLEYAVLGHGDSYQPVPSGHAPRCITDDLFVFRLAPLPPEPCPHCGAMGAACLGGWAFHHAAECIWSGEHVLATRQIPAWDRRAACPACAEVAKWMRERLPQSIRDNDGGAADLLAKLEGGR